jgi:copper transport protein
MNRSLRRGLEAVAATVAIIGMPARAAFAHAALETSTPAANSVLEDAPTEVVLDFDEDIEIGLADVRVFGADGVALEVGRPAAGADGTVLTASLPQMGDGIYAVIWKVTSADGHAVEGAFSFQVGTAGGGNAQDLIDQVSGGGGTSSGLTWFYGIARFMALAGAIALLGGGLWSLQGRPRLGSLPGVRRLLWVGWALLLLGAIGAFMGFSAQATTGRVADVLSTGSWSDVASTTTGRMLAVRVLLAVLLGLLLWQRSAADTGWWRGVAASAGVLTFLTFSASGHPNSLSPRLLWVTIDELHLVAVAVWLGGLLALLCAGRAWLAEPEAVRPVERFSFTSSIAVPVIVATGVAQTLKLAGGLSDVTATDWGRMLLTKVMLVIAMVALGGVSRWLLQHDGAGSIRRTVAVEAVVGIAVIALAAGIVGQPPRVGTPSEVHTATVTANGVIAEVTVTPGQVGGNDIHVVVTPAGGSLTPVASATARVLLPAEGVPESPVALTAEGPNHFSGRVTFPRSGEWSLEIVVNVTESSSVLLKDTVVVP